MRTISTVRTADGLEGADEACTDSAHTVLNRAPQAYDERDE